MISHDYKIRENDTLKESLPYERFLKNGAESLTDTELLAIIIRTGSIKSSPMDIASNVMKMSHGRNRGLNGLYSLTVDELMTIDGIGEVKAVKLKCLSELSKRMSMQLLTKGLDCSCASSIADYYMERLRHEEREQAVLLCLNNRLRLIEDIVISVGTVNSASLSPRDIFAKALKCGASNIVLLHNHPGGDPTPSRSDISVTNKIRESGFMLDIILKDHIIIGDKTYYSFSEKGLLWE